MTRRVRAMLLVLTAGFAINTHAGNIVSDSGFENATLGPSSTTLGDGFWIVTGGAISVFDVANGEGGVPHSGNQMAYLDDATTNNTLTQNLVTVVSQSYTVSYWVADNDPNSLVVNFGSQNLFTGFAPTAGVSVAGEYVNESFVVIANSTSTALSFTGHFLGGDGSYGTLLDDVSVTANIAPEPSTWAFLAAGLGALKLWKRRSKVT
jgi:hypothetical protein